MPSFRDGSTDPFSRSAVVFALLLGCFWEVAASARADDAPFRSIYIPDVPHVLQKPDFCGEACAEMVLRKLGRPVDQDAVFDQAGLDPAEGRGCYTPELVTALRRIGFRTGQVWWGVSAEKPQPGLDWLFEQLHADLLAGVPSILCMLYDDGPDSTEHFRLVLGYDAERDEIVYHEPAVRGGSNRRMKREKLFQLWPLKYDEDRWTVVRIRLEAGRLIDKQPTERFTNADYAQHVWHLKRDLEDLRKKQINLQEERQKMIDQEIEKEKQLLAEGKEYEGIKPPPRIVSDFHIVIEEPFVVIGDDSLDTVSAHAAGTIRWAVDRLKQDFFANDPEQILNIWLFKDEESYRQNVYDIFGSRPHTPFGYYSSWHKALVMNISTGGGTLVHEIVHPLMEANFSDCPSWLNEGMGSLFEQCQDVNGHIHGLTNWRLRGLQRAIEQEAKDRDDEKLKEEEKYKLPTFDELCHTTRRDFYDRDPGTNYAQARYLCYYLQEKNLLIEFFHQAARDVNEDPGGYQTLLEILEVTDVEKFEQEWKTFVTELSFP